jgi:hypothetical protein
MADAEPTVQDLFKRWRGGDAEAGQAMAQKFTDWYYAVSAVRLGDARGRVPLQQACTAFAQGITTVTRAGALVDWAHEIVQREVDGAGGRIDGGDFPNALTGHRSPVHLLEQVRPHLSNDHVTLLHATYAPQTSLEALTALAEEHGGWPLAVLEARYALKRALRDHARVNFSVVPDKPVLDRAPLPLYEAARMATADEDAAFEKWLISELELCRDVAEFATFAHALRSGAFEAPAIAPPPIAAPAPAPAAAAPAPEIDQYDDENERSGPPGWAIGVAVAGVLAALVAIVVVLFFFLDPQ